LWELAGRAGLVDLRFLPLPSAVTARLFALCFSAGGTFSGDLGISLARVFAGTLLAAPCAILLAALSELSPFVGALTRPWVAFLYPLPKLALLPVILVFLGLGEASKVALVAFGVFFLVFLSTAQGIRRVMQSEYYDVALVYRIPFRKRFFQVLLRGATPEIVNGTKMGLGYGLVMVIAAEFTASQRGVGVFIWDSWDQFRVLDLYAGLLAVSVVGWLIFLVAGFAERRFSRYD
jgi:NitT/TauT family transport system permease protein